MFRNPLWEVLFYILWKTIFVNSLGSVFLTSEAFAMTVHETTALEMSPFSPNRAPSSRDFKNGDHRGLDG